jgi:hypothetical protein
LRPTRDAQRPLPPETGGPLRPDDAPPTLPGI